MKFFSFADIRAAADCREIAAELYGCKVANGRCAALWRGGDDPENVSIKREEFYDHVEKAGGGPIELAAFKFDGNMQAAQEWLGERYRLEPRHGLKKPPTPESRYDQLIRDGYKEVAAYKYTDLSGVLVHFVVRLEHPNKPGKEFCQGIPDGDSVRWGLHGTTTILYRLDVVSSSEWVALVEGEKSADRMNAIGIPATTACGGAKKWHDGLTEALRGKHVAIFPDNDEPGREHADVVARAIYGSAASVKIVRNHSSRHKGGVDDWLDEDGGHGEEDVLRLIQDAPAWNPPSAPSHQHVLSSPCEVSQDALDDAKQANKLPFRNYVPNATETIKKGKVVNETVKEPRTHQALLDDLSRRFLGFPRRVGTRLLFDHDKDSGKIVELDTPTQLIAWIGRRSKHNADFARGDGFVSMAEFFESVVVTAHQYEAISAVPDWPRRDEVYYAHGALPPPSSGRRLFNDLLDMFLPASEVDRALIAAFVCCPLWYIPGVPRPSWIIDSKDAQGSGKTKMVELISELYGSAPITICKSDLERDQKEVRKRCVSRTGRNARFLLMDNVTGNFKSSELSAMMTAKYISGMAPYGHGEESRPNNLVYVITSNSATVDSDIADRSLYIYVKKPSDRLGWIEKVQSFIDKNRLGIVSDIIDLLSNSKPYSMPVYRFSEFDAYILQPCCGTAEMYQKVIRQVGTVRSESNADEDHARAIMDTFAHRLGMLGLADTPVFLQNKIVNSWMRDAVSDSYEFRSNEYPIQLLRNLAKIKLVSPCNPDTRRWPRSSSSPERFSGLGWNLPDDCMTATVVYKTADGDVQTKLLGSSRLVEY